MDQEELRRVVIDRRNALGWTQTELADRAGVSLGTVQNIEGGKTKPQRAKRDLVLDALGLPEDESASGSDGEELVLRRWPPHIAVFFDVLGVYLSRFDDDEQLEIIHDLTRQIFQNPRHDS